MNRYSVAGRRGQLAAHFGPAGGVGMRHTKSCVHRVNCIPNFIKRDGVDGFGQVISVLLLISTCTIWIVKGGGCHDFLCNIGTLSSIFQPYSTLRSGRVWSGQG